MCFFMPRPCLPTAVVPTMSLCRSLLSAWETACLADHFPHVRVSMPTFLIKSSVDCFRVTTILPLATLNSSTIEVIGSFSWLVLPYSPGEARRDTEPSPQVSVNQSLESLNSGSCYLV